MITDHPLDGLLDAMLWSATRLVGAVRARDPQEVAAVLEPLDRTGLSALLIAVAAMVPDDQTIGQLVLWSHAPVVSDEEYEQLTAFDAPPGKKLCKGCGELLDLQDFYRLKGSPDGRRPQCIACTAEADAERRRKRSEGKRTRRSKTVRCEPQRQREAA